MGVGKLDLTVMIFALFVFVGGFVYGYYCGYTTHSESQKAEEVHDEQKKDKK